MNEERIKAMVAVIGEIKRIHNVKGKRKHKVDIVGEFGCPLCCAIVDYLVSGYNGHTRGQCRTEGCLGWIE